LIKESFDLNTSIGVQVSPPKISVSCHVGLLAVKKASTSEA
jgi:hypothetical protein